MNELGFPVRSFNIMRFYTVITHITITTCKLIIEYVSIKKC